MISWGVTFLYQSHQWMLEKKTTSHQELDVLLRIHTNKPFKSFHDASHEESRTCKAILWKQKQSTPRTRWINTEQPSKQPCCRLCVSIRQDNLHLWIVSGNFQAQLWKRRFFPHVVLIPCRRITWVQQWEQAREEIYNLSDSPWFESRICTPADHVHCWHTSSSGRNAPLDLFALGTQ